MDGVIAYLTGTSQHRLDGKNRCHIPQRIRCASRDGSSGDVVHSTFFLIPKGLCAYLLTPEQFQVMAQEVPREGLAEDDEVARRQRRFFARARQVEVDAQGRITVPPEIVEKIGLDPAPTKAAKGESAPARELVIAGCGNRAELWSSMRWQEEESAFD